MSEAGTCLPRAEPESLPENLRSVQPGGGRCYQIELAWGKIRRWYLRTFRPGYVRRMKSLRTGHAGECPHDVLDPRDLKYCRNLCTADWPSEHDRFAWRERIPMARWGLAEVQLMGWPMLALTLWIAMASWPLSLGGIVPGVLFILIVYFFRDPIRAISQQAGAIVSPADGKVVEVERVEDDPYIGGPAIRIGIFLSIFNVHINRAPLKSRVIKLDYRPGLFLNALNPESALRNESLWIGLEEEESPHRKLIVRQISGLFARRIVCNLRSGEVVERGHKFGMIKLGSRTELILADDDLEITVQVGQKVRAGSSLLAQYGQSEDLATGSPS